MATSIDYMAVAHGRAFQRRVMYAMFDAGKDVLSGAPSANEIAYIAGITNGEAPVLQMAVGVLMDADVRAALDLDVSGAGVTDAEVKVAVVGVFSIYADGWSKRTL